MIRETLLVAALAGTAAAQVSIDGSFPNTAPTNVGTFGFGVTSVTGSVVNALGAATATPAPDVDTFTFTIANGTFLSSITLTSIGFAAPADPSPALIFGAIAEGTSFPFSASQLSLLGNSNPSDDPGSLSDFLGGVLFGDSAPETIPGGPGIPVGGDLLAGLAAANAGGAGFSLPLGPGTYTFYIQQLGGSVASYDLAFTVVPAPSALAVLGLGGLVAGRRRR